LTWEFALPKFKGSHLEAKRNIFEYIEVFYNLFRLLSAIGYEKENTPDLRKSAEQWGDRVR
jgi:hypothetical protein